MNGEYQLSLTTAANEYTIDVGTNATCSATGGGVVTAVYQINTDVPFAVPITGWGASALGFWYRGV